MTKNPRVAIEIPPLNRILGRLEQGANPLIGQVMQPWRTLLVGVTNPTFALRPLSVASGSIWTPIPNPEQELQGILGGYLASIGKEGQRALPMLVSASRLPQDLPAAPEEAAAQQQLTRKMPWGLPPWWQANVAAPPAPLVSLVELRIQEGMGSLIRVLRRELEGAIGSPKAREPWSRLPVDLWERTLESIARSFAVAFSLAALRIPGDALANMHPLLWGIASGILPVGHMSYEGTQVQVATCIFLVA